jgi:hypothetical protein
LFAEGNALVALQAVDRCISCLLEAGAERPPPDADWSFRASFIADVRGLSWELRNQLAPLRALLEGADEEVDRLRRKHEALLATTLDRGLDSRGNVDSERRELQESLLVNREARHRIAVAVAEADRVLAATERDFAL